MALYGTISPDVPLSSRNIIHNGNMVICQRSASNTGLTSESFAATDRYSFGIYQQGTWKMNNETSGISTGEFPQCSNIICTTANTSPGTSSFVFVAQGVEGYNLQMVKKGTSNAEYLTLSFWAKSNKTGTYIIELEDNTNGRSISQAYTVSVANTWEKKKLTFAPDTTGTWPLNNTRSLRVFFWFGGGSGFTSGTLNTSWNTSVSANRLPGCNNLADAVGNYFAFTGVQLEVGRVATPYEHVNYLTSLMNCQRYFYSHATSSLIVQTGQGGVASRSSTSGLKNPVEMRTSPTVVITNLQWDRTDSTQWASYYSGSFNTKDGRFYCDSGGPTFGTDGADSATYTATAEI